MNIAWGLLGVVGLTLCVFLAYKFSGHFPAHFLRPIEVEFENKTDVLSCGTVQALESQRLPVNTGPQIWGFGRIAGLNVKACQPGQLKFNAYRRKVKNTPSRWEVFLNNQFLVSGLVNDRKEVIEIDIDRPGLISLIFSNAYNAKDNVKERRTMFFENIQFIENK